MAQLAYAPVLGAAPAQIFYSDCIRDIANEALNGECTHARILGVAKHFGVSAASVDQEVNEQIEMIKDL